MIAQEVRPKRGHSKVKHTSCSFSLSRRRRTLSAFELMTTPYCPYNASTVQRRRNFATSPLAAVDFLPILYYLYESTSTLSSLPSKGQRTDLRNPDSCRTRAFTTARVAYYELRFTSLCVKLSFCANSHRSKIIVQTNNYCTRDTM